MENPSYKVEQLKFKEGPINYLLVRRSDGLPLNYENFFITLNYFRQSYASNTIKAVAYHLSYFTAICDFLNINIQNRFKDGKLLTASEIESITSWLMRHAGTLYAEDSRKKAKNVVSINIKKVKTVNYTIVINENLVEPETTYNRIITVAEYVAWLAGFFQACSSQEIERMKARLLRHLPIKINRFNDDEPFKSLDEKDKTAMLMLVEPDAKNNPWKHEEIKHRNKLIVYILLYVGCRKGELLSLKATDIDPNDRIVRIRKKFKTKLIDEEQRKNPAFIKTLSRDIQVPEELHILIQDYILKYRSKVIGANKSSYLFLSHQNGAKKARPLSHSAVDKIFGQIKSALTISAFPHALRHTWNDKFSENIEELLDTGEMSKSEAEDTRSYAMGWKPDSGTAKTYTRRYEQKKAMKIGLFLQKKVRAKDKEIIDVINMDVPF